MIKSTFARLNRAHKRAALVHELRAMRTWGGPCADARAPRIVEELVKLDAEDRADPSSWPRVAAPMPTLQRAAPVPPGSVAQFRSAALQALVLVLVALAVGSLWN